jgi:hypothetical protein
MHPTEIPYNIDRERNNAKFSESMQLRDMFPVCYAKMDNLLGKPNRMSDSTPLYTAPAPLNNAKSGG